MKRLNQIMLVILIGFNCQAGHAQEEIDQEAYRKQYRKNQLKLDRQFGGIGIEWSQPNFGDGIRYNNERWIGVDLMSDFFHFNYAVGSFESAADRLEKDETPFFYGRENTGRHLCVGIHFPLPVGLGRQTTFSRVFRINPVMGFDMGAYKFWEGRQDVGQLYYMSLNTALRLRVPFMSFEFGAKFRAGIESTDYLNVFNGSGIHTYFTLRFDGLKTLLKPSIVSVDAAQVSATQIGQSSNSYYRYGRNGVYSKVTQTSTTYDVKVTRSKMGFQDIGTFLGVGPRVGFNSFRSRYHTDRGRLFGVGIQARSGMLSFGLNMEGGRIGHASAMQDNGEKIKRRVDKSETFAQGSNFVYNTFFDVGYDISDGLLSMMGTVTDRTGITSYFSVAAGYSFGFSFVGGHRWNDNVDFYELEQHTEALKDDLEKFKEHHAGGDNGKSGYLGGWYVATEVGAMQARFQWYKYYRAPLLNNFVISLTYRLPLAHLKK